MIAIRRHAASLANSLSAERILASPRATRLTAAALLISTFTLAACLIIDDRNQTLERAGTTLSNVSESLARDIARNVALYDLAIRESKDALLLPGIADLDAGTRRAAMFSRVATAPQLEAILALDENGNIRYDSESTTPRTTNLADRDYFSYHRNHDDGTLFTSGPLRSRLTGTDNIVFSRRVSHADGSFAGAVVAAVKLTFFEQLFRQLDMGPEGSIALIRTDGVVVARWPWRRDQVGRNISRSPAFHAMLEQRAGLAETDSSVDGMRRIYAFRQVDDLPLLVAAGFGRNDVLAFWRRKATITTAAFVALLGLAGILAAACRKELTRRAQAEADARSAAANLSLAQQETSEALGRLKAIFDHSVDAHFAASRRPDGQFAYEALNAAARNLTGLRTQDVFGKSPAECLPAEAAASVTGHWQRCIRERHAQYYAHTLDLPAGRRHWEGVIVPVFDGNGTICRIIGTARDLTEHRRTQEALLKVNDHLEQRVMDVLAERESALRRAAMAERMQALGQLAGGIAHDFNNVLQGVSGCAILIESRSHDPAACRRLARMTSESAERGASITRRLLAFARRDELRTEPVVVADLLQGLLEILTHTLGSRVEVRVMENDAIPPVLVDRGQLENVLLNLATNAGDAMPSGGLLTFKTAKVQVGAGHPSGVLPGRYVELSVADTGVGMDEATLARVTEPFFTTKPVGKGTGLGLSMAKGFAEQSNGFLTLASVPGIGTTVTIILPEASAILAEASAIPPEASAILAEASAIPPEASAILAEASAIPPEASAGQVQPTAAPAVRATTAARHKRILVVEDDPVIRETLAELLDDEYSVICAQSGEEAISILHSGQPVDALVTDMTMPGISGLSLIQEAQSQDPHLPAILLTGYAGDLASLAVSGAVSGRFSLLRKPITSTDLMDRLAALLASHGAERSAAV